MKELVNYLLQRPWGVRLLAGSVLLFLPLFVVIIVIATAIEEGVFEDFGGQLKTITRSLCTGRINS
jgi:hypothetical protein